MIFQCTDQCSGDDDNEHLREMNINRNVTNVQCLSTVELFLISFNGVLKYSNFHAFIKIVLEKKNRIIGVI